MGSISIECYRQEYRSDFVHLNREWIQTYFRLECSDHKVFNDPEGTILKGGGQIFFAVDKEQGVLGCCALIRHDDSLFELAKMAVSPGSQGRGVGRLLGEAALRYARDRGCRKLFLEGNTQLAASIALYRKLGFKEVAMREVVYDRCDIRMELEL